MKDMNRRWKQVRKMIPDTLSTRLDAINMISHASMTGQDAVKAFQAWFDSALQMVVLGNNGSWVLPYVRGAGDIGVARGLKLVGANAMQFPDRVPALQTLCITELQGIMESVSQQAVRTLSLGLLNKQSPAAIGRLIQQIIDKTGVGRSDLLVSFIVVRTFGAATLDVFRAKGVPAVGTIAERTGLSPPTPSQDGLVRDAKGKPKSYRGVIRAEAKLKKKYGKTGVDVLTAGDNKVCPVCSDISDNGPYTLDHAESLIPAHPNCRCAFVPADLDVMDDGTWNEELHPRDKDGKFATKEGQVQAIKNKLLKIGVPVVHHTETPSEMLEISSMYEEYFEMQAGKIGLNYAKADEFFGTDVMGKSDYDEQSSYYFIKHGNKQVTAPVAQNAIDMKDLKKVGEAMGSNKGGVYENEFGSKYYIKEPKTKDHVANELLAAKLYQTVGSSTMQYVPVKGDAHVATVLESLDKNNIKQFDDTQLKAVQKDFAVHAWLANHDAVGTGGDNQVVPKGAYFPTTVDVGGSLKYRAQGELKDNFGPHVIEITTMRNPSISPDAAKVFGSMNNEEMTASIKRVTDIPDEKIKAVVNQSGLSQVDKEIMSAKLIARKNDLAAQAEKMVSEAPSPIPSIQVLAPEPTTFKTKMEHAKHLLMKGTTSEELKKALNWPAIGVPATAESLNLKLEKTKVGKAFFYKGTPMTAAEITAAKALKKAGKGEVPIKTSAPAAEIKVAPSAFDPEPAPAKHDITTTAGNFKQSLEEHGVKYGVQQSASGQFITLSDPKDVSKGIEISKYHPKIEKLSAHEYFAGNENPVVIEPPKPAPSTATAAELEKAKKSSKLTAQYVPGAPKDHPEAEKLISEFNKKYEGKNDLTPEQLKTKVDDFKKLQQQMVPLMSAQQQIEHAHKLKAEAEQAAKAAAAKAEQVAKVAAVKAAHEAAVAKQKAEFEAKMSDPKVKAEYAALKAIDHSDAPDPNIEKWIKQKGLNITTQDAKFIRAYVGSYYGDVNKQLRKGIMSNEQSHYAKALRKALKKMPTYEGDVVRGIEDNDGSIFAKYQSALGGTIVEPQFTSAGVHSKLWGDLTLHIKSKFAADIRAFNPSEGGGEVVFRSGTHFHVTNVDKTKKKVWLEEIDW